MSPVTCAQTGSWFQLFQTQPQPLCSENGRLDPCFVLQQAACPFLLHTLNVCSGKRRVSHASYSYSLKALKEELQQIICRAAKKADSHGHFLFRHIRSSCSALKFPLRLFRSVSAIVAWIPGRQNNQWGVKSFPH